MALLSSCNEQQRQTGMETLRISRLWTTDGLIFQIRWTILSSAPADRTRERVIDFLGGTAQGRDDQAKHNYGNE